MVQNRLGALILGLIFIAGLVLFSQEAEAATTTTCGWFNTSSTCESYSNCKFHQSPWGSWCEQKGCWNFWTQTECNQGNNQSSTSFINKTCSWSSTSSGWCGQIDCWSFDGNEAGCTTANTTYGIECSWLSTYNAAEYDYPCNGPGGKNCWSNQNQSSCQNVTGCEWGMCSKVSCWDYSNTNLATCQSHKGYNGKSCKWKTYSWGSQCEEDSCWNYGNQSTCTTGNCTWSGSYCTERSCSTFGGFNSTYCVNNAANLSCTWDSTGKWCGEAGCWNYNSQNTCNSVGNCLWEDYSTGWCQEQGCWSWDSNQTGCLDADNLFHPGIDCAYSGTWCFTNISSKSCSDLTIQKDCMDSFHCWWNFSASTCNNPNADLGQVTSFVEWNPGCYIFDREQAICQNITGVNDSLSGKHACFWNTSSSLCGTNLSIIPSGQLNCSFISNQTVCNGISNLGSCCKWQGSSCVPDKFDQSCREQMQEPPEGASYCEDYNAYTNNNTCLQIAGYPWFMPCKWDNTTERCQFKGTDVFGAGEKNIMVINSEQNCEAAGGKWVIDTYPSTNDPATAVRLSLGRCDYKFDEERNCDKECSACEYKTDGTNWTSLDKAKEVCVSSALKICAFKPNSQALNGYGFCEPKEEFKKGLVEGDCDTECSACTFMGDSTATCTKTSCPKPSNYCAASKAKCKWVADPAHSTDENYGVCVSKSEKTCEDKCDKCYDETYCKNTGGKKGNTSADLAAVCKWETGICKYISGASSMEICWDGTDNNGDNKMDCADSMCYSDPFCGGAAMFTSFGKDCFIFTTEANCAAEGCAWVNENWGSWCDLPGSVCWKQDGNQTGCENNGNCSWHSGFGGFCEQDWTMGGAMSTGGNCMGKNQTTCMDNTVLGYNCTWVIDDWCTSTGGGGYCDPDPAWTGAWYNCAQHDTNGQTTCESHSECNWYTDSWCSTQGANAGYCDHMSFACYQFNTQAECIQAINATYNHSQWCTWKSDIYMGDHCEGKMMGGAAASGGGNCWGQATELGCNATTSCKWTDGFCDPKGFGGEKMAGMQAGGTGAAMGGSGMQCFKYDGNQTKCTNQTGCGWFSQPWPLCDINKESNCPQYSFNQGDCSAQPGCKWNPTSSFCDEKGFECYWNSTLQSNFTLCDEHPLCYNTTSAGPCNPKSFNATTRDECTSLNATLFRWMDGWCNPAMGAEYFKGMDMGGPPIPLGSDANDIATTVANEVDITSFGMKDMGDTFGFGTTVDSPLNSAACNDIKMASGMGTGTNKTTFFWYLDTDGTHTNSDGCTLKHNSSLGGYEFYVKNSWAYDSQSASVSESPAVYRCVSGSWQLAEIKASSQSYLMCTVVGGAMVAVDKAELKKFSDLYTTGEDIRVAVASADATHNVTNPSDTADPGWVTPGSQDFELLDLYGYETDATKKAKKGGSGAGFINYGEEADCWTIGGCGNYSCKEHPFCEKHGYGVEASTWTDTRIPIVTGVVKEVYPDSAVISYFTDKPANGTILFYNRDSTCLASSLNATIYIPGQRDPTKEGSYGLEHLSKIYNDGGYASLTNALNPDLTYYFKVKVCDDTGKCGESACSSFITESDATCSFCKFVSRIDVPAGWNVYYDLDQTGGYEHWQGHILGVEDGVFTNYTTGRNANILLNTTDGKAQVEFINVTLTKSGMSPKIRDVDSSGAMKNGTTTDANGATVGYVGMIDDTRDKIVNNLYPQVCKIKIPGTGTCTALWNCDSSNANCVDRTSNATLVETGSNYCIWQIPCEFSNWAGGQPGTPSSSDSSTSSSGGSSGGGGNCQAGYTLVDGGCVKTGETKEAEEVAAEVPAGEVPAGEVPAGEVAGEVPAGEVAGEAAQKASWPWIVAIVLVIIIAAGVIIYLKRRR